MSATRCWDCGRRFQQIFPEILSGLEGSGRLTAPAASEEAPPKFDWRECRRERQQHPARLGRNGTARVSGCVSGSSSAPATQVRPHPCHRAGTRASALAERSTGPNEVEAEEPDGVEELGSRDELDEFDGVEVGAPDEVKAR